MMDERLSKVLVLACFCDTVFASPLCNRQLAVTNGSLSISDALRGLTISVGTGNWQPFVVFSETSRQYEGFEVDLLNTISAAAGFKYTMQTLSKPEHMSWTQALPQFLSSFDLVTYGYWVIDGRRYLDGAVSPFGFLDASYMLVGRNLEANGDNIMTNMTLFLQPFETSVWLCTLGTIGVTALLYWIFEHSNKEEFPSSETRDQFAESIYKSWLGLTTLGGLAPSTWPGKIIVASWAWFALLFVSMYTANIAAYFVLRNASPARFANIDEAMQQSAVICTTSGPIKDYVEIGFPRYKHFVHLVSGSASTAIRNSDIANALNEGKCEAVIMAKHEWDLHFEDNHLLDSNCDLALMGQPLQKMFAGWMTDLDYSVKCTVLVRDVLAFYFHSLDTEQKLSNLLLKLEQDVKKSSCSRRLRSRSGAAADDSDSSSPIEKLGLEAMSGIFGLHALAIASGLGILFFGRLCIQAEKKAVEQIPSTKIGTEAMELFHKFEKLLLATEQRIEAMTGTFHSNERTVEL